ncbi:PTS system, cellobiose-specific IIC component [Spiroplasma helicoides]|uniref:PTS system, cellobiose-specific IIC component n=1 Tax=Spiroplasma helicoides TaxID=216938 RepID=A0A1B3SJP9_9MOLU|nr:PTS transporter subunit EIIC [Spiroplasma helicoides]AOG60156.1 PTS system, cellobiose-specific IIC component [Spiroplasma helicoides]
MERYEKFPEIKNIYKKILKSKDNYKKNILELKSSKPFLYEKKYKIRKVKRKFRRILRVRIKELKSRFRLELRASKYKKTDIKYLYLNFQANLINLKDEYKKKADLSYSKLKDEINTIISANRVISDKNKAIIASIKEAKSLFKVKWKDLEDDRKANELILLQEYKRRKYNYRTKRKEFKKEFKIKRNTLIEDFKNENPNMEHFKFTLYKFMMYKLKPFKNENEEKIYNLVLKINEIKVQSLNKIHMQKKFLLDARNEILYNKGKEEPITFKTLVNILTMGIGKVTSWKYMVALRNAFYSLIPMMIVGAIFMFINNIMLSSEKGGFFSLFNLNVNSIELLNRIKLVGNYIEDATYSFYSIILAGAVAYHLARFYNMSKWSCATLAVCSFAILNTNIFTEISAFGNSGIFSAFIIGSLSTVIYAKISKSERFSIRFYGKVPEGISKSFKNLIPFAITLAIFGVSALIIAVVGSQIGPVTISGVERNFNSLNEVIIIMFQKSVEDFHEGYGKMIAILFEWQLLSFVGIYAKGVLGPIVGSEQIMGLHHNQEAIANGLKPTFVFTNSFMNNFVQMGGTGGTIGLIIAILILSKRLNWRIIAKLTLIPAIFGINEPLVYSLPLIFNWVLLIPFILAPLLAATFAYITTIWGIFDYTTESLSTIIPPIVGGYLSTGNIGGAILALLCMSILIICYLPFVAIGNNTFKSDNNQNDRSLDIPNLVIQNRVDGNDPPKLGFSKITENNRRF